MDEGLPPGRYPYAIYRWRKLGLKEDSLFQAVASSPEVSSRIMSLLETARAMETPCSGLKADEEIGIEQAHYQLWLDARATHIEHMTQTAQSRLASLNATHQARLALLAEQRDVATDARIRRMRVAQIEAATRDYEARAEVLSSAPQKADIVAEALGFGILSGE